MAESGLVVSMEDECGSHDASVFTWWWSERWWQRLGLVADDGDGAPREEEESTREGKPDHFAGCPPKSFQNTDCSLPKQQPLISLKHGSLLMLFPVLFLLFLWQPLLLSLREDPPNFLLTASLYRSFYGKWGSSLAASPFSRIFSFSFFFNPHGYPRKVRTWWLLLRFYRPLSSLVSVLLNHSGCVSILINMAARV